MSGGDRVPGIATFHQDPDPKWQAIKTTADRVTELEARVEDQHEVLRGVVTAAVHAAMPHSMLTEKQVQWVELAIEREAQSIAFRRAMIEKTLAGAILLVLGSLAAGTWLIVREWLNTRGLRL